jgi:hypothetical protein
MKKWIFVCLASTTFGLLPPLAQSTRELKELLNDPRLYEALGSAEMIQEIVRIDHGYRVFTQNYAIQVNLHYKRGGMIGPAQFELEFESPERISFRAPELMQ